MDALECKIRAEEDDQNIKLCSLLNAIVGHFSLELLKQAGVLGKRSDGQTRNRNINWWQQNTTHATAFAFK